MEQTVIGTIATRLRAMLSDGALDLPIPGGGDTHCLLDSLARLAARDLSLARLVEAHVDAVSILTQAGIPALPDTLYGVWAAEQPQHRLTLERHGDNYRVTGSKAFATGAGIVDRALVTAHLGAHVHLVDIDARTGLAWTLDDWRTPAFAETSTATATVPEALLVADRALIGGPDWYHRRPGFWLGALAPAACWAGGAIGLADSAIQALTARTPDTLTDVALGELAALRMGLESILRHAAATADTEPATDAARRSLALAMRHLVERQAVAVIDGHDRALGPRPLIRDPWARLHIEELRLFIRQCHAERDLASLGQAVRAEH